MKALENLLRGTLCFTLCLIAGFVIYKVVSADPMKTYESVSEDLKIDAFNDWSIEFAPEKEIAKICKTLGGASNHPALGGLTVFTKKTVMLSDNKATAANSIMHEFGHVLDYESGWISRTEEWAEIYKAEKKVLRRYAQSSPEEFFADVYSNLALNDRPERTPRATEFVLSVISKR
ncbi:MAG: hypothetical protein IK121_03590 [Lachnospiraceae bacterium]|nr:hypothetical protein [Lachnospiraceae bacterium]